MTATCTIFSCGGWI